jgi:hypothetical protein
VVARASPRLIPFGIDRGNAPARHNRYFTCL